MRWKGLTPVLFSPRRFSFPKNRKHNTLWIVFFARLGRAAFAQLWTAPVITVYVSIICSCVPDEEGKVVRLALYFDVFP